MKQSRVSKAINALLTLLAVAGAEVALVTFNMHGLSPMHAAPPAALALLVLPVLAIRLSVGYLTNRSRDAIVRRYEQMLHADKARVSMMEVERKRVQAFRDEYAAQQAPEKNLAHGLITRR